MKKFGMILLGFALPLFADPFEHASVALEGGALYMTEDVEQVLDNTYYVLGEFRYEYFRHFRGVVQMGYAYIPTLDNADYPGIHQVNGRVGADYPLPIAKPIAVGAGFSCVWMRADDDGDVSKSTLADNESEFGWYARLDLPIILLENWKFGAKFYYETLWTEPDISHTAWFGLYIERKLW